MTSLKLIDLAYGAAVALTAVAGAASTTVFTKLSGTATPNAYIFPAQYNNSEKFSIALYYDSAAATPTWRFALLENDLSPCKKPNVTAMWKTNSNLITAFLTKALTTDDIKKSAADTFSGTATPSVSYNADRLIAFNALYDVFRDRDFSVQDLADLDLTIYNFLNETSGAVIAGLAGISYKKTGVLSKYVMTNTSTATSKALDASNKITGNDIAIAALMSTLNSAADIEVKFSVQADDTFLTVKALSDTAQKNFITLIVVTSVASVLIILQNIYLMYLMHKIAKLSAGDDDGYEDDNFSDTVVNANKKFSDTVVNAYSDTVVNANKKFSDTVVNAYSDTVVNANKKFSDTVVNAYSDTVVNANKKFSDTVVNAYSDTVVNANKELSDTVVNAYSDTVVNA